MAELWEEIILVAIPTIAGIATSKWLTGSWQKQKTKNEVKRKILSEYTNSLLNGVSRMVTFQREVNMEIQSFSLKIKNRGDTSDKSKKFVIPLELFEAEFTEFDKKYWESLVEVNKLFRSLRLYFQNVKKLERMLVKLYEKYQRMYFELRRLMTSEDNERYQHKKSKFLKEESEFNEMAESFEKDLIDEPVLIKI